MRHIRRLLLIAALLYTFGFELGSVHGTPPTTHVFTGLVASGPTPSGPSSQTHPIPVEAGDLLDVTLDYGGTIGCGITLLEIEIDGTTYPIPYSGFLFSGTTHYTAQATVAGNLLIVVRIGCAHSPSPSGNTMSYTLTVGINIATPPVPPPNNPFATEEAAGLWRVATIPVVIYSPTFAAVCDGKLFIEIWALNEHAIWQPALYITKAELAALPEFPSENLLIARVDTISVYKLTTGEYQVNVGPLKDGKVHVVIFEGIPPAHTYRYTFYATP
ncbi:MAG: hypothetical protein BroJett018_28430 [Chloroflexota bacterium]|nr:hypothetical protein [Chloroflexota bacterium]NOG63719.1 hypothetical protein [Chloroflexota bacterium]GIK65049.1 MAG: hypothetical protein BroJett018_28430 [Chloroflexota bacterium]